jgi:hypothetical protein
LCDDDFQLGCIADFQIRMGLNCLRPPGFCRAADLKIGDTAAWEICATRPNAHYWKFADARDSIPQSPFNQSTFA